MDTTIEDIQADWKTSFEKLPQEVDVKKALLFGARYRVNLRKLLEAVLKTGKLCLEVKKVIVGAADAATWLDLPESAWNVLTTGLAAFREKLTPAQYFAGVMLSAQAGCPVTDFARELERFIGENWSVAPFYLGLTEKRAAAAKADLRKTKPEAILDELRDKGYIDESGGTLRFRDSNFVWGFDAKVD